MPTVQHLPTCERGRTEQAIKTNGLRLLDLPLDILQTIVKAITHTNDLTSLALTHSVLHSLVTPFIYSRFDIVWPDVSPTSAIRSGVDALTYGLATLVKAQDVFGAQADRPRPERCVACGSLTFCRHRSAPPRPSKTRRGNNFAQYTRKFSLGNGPEEWVKDYLITKEAGKMLGTLVALAIARMRNLETFTWDMPTGVLRDVWLALASLDDGDDDGAEECHLERVWVRWHDNQDAVASSPFAENQPGLRDIPRLLRGASGPRFEIPPYPRVEFPTFSVLPALKSLTVLDIDELSYVEEMSVLIERSSSRLRELRISLAHHAQNSAWARPREDRTIVPPPCVQPGEDVRRHGGLLGILVSRFCESFDEDEQQFEGPLDRHVRADGMNSLTKKLTAVHTGDKTPKTSITDLTQLESMLEMQHLEDETPSNTTKFRGDPGKERHPSPVVDFPLSKRHQEMFPGVSFNHERKLRLDILELERIFLSTSALSQAFDWSRLQTLTILGCRDHEQLWKVLRKTYAPTSRVRSSSLSKITSPNQSLFGCPPAMDATTSSPSVDYKLRITRIHTDCVSTALLAFLKDTLAPNSLECLFLQQSPAYKSMVTIDQIYKHAIRPHRTSLKKLLIDSDIRTVNGTFNSEANWRRWTVSRELITCITSGRMGLRELSISIEYKDWHYFLQRLPNASSLRSMHITNIAGYTHGHTDAREVALQVLDIVALRPELELCYLGIEKKCFEILEYPGNRKPPHPVYDPDRFVTSAHLEDEALSDGHDERENEDSQHDSDDLNLITDQEESDGTEDEAQQEGPRNALQLREILFYDDKISIFKARHGTL